MCSADQAEGEGPAIMPPVGYSVGCKRPIIAVALFDVDHDAAVEQRAPKRAQAGAIVPYVAPQPEGVEPAEAVTLAVLPTAADVPVASDTAMVLYVAPQPDRIEPPEAITLAALPATADMASDAAMVLYVAPPTPIDAWPINAVPFAAAAPGPERRRKAEMPMDDMREAPSWMRKILLSQLELRFDLPVHFITEKTVTKTDLDPHQNRFRLPTDAVQRHLIPILTDDEAASANLLQDVPPRARAPREPENTDAVADGKQEPSEKRRRKKKKGKKHGGLDVTLVHLTAGKKKLQLSRWESSHGTIIKGDGYIEFIKSCGFMESDTVQIWAFKEREFRNFGAIFTKASPLYIVLVGAPRPPVQSAAPAPAPEPTVAQPDKQ
ncbi:hypothetical protein ABZP36_034350 [Zizania latifolia]